MAARDWAKLGTGSIVSCLAVGLTVSLLFLMLLMPSRQPPALWSLAETSTLVATIILCTFHAWGCLYLWLYPIPAGHSTACGYNLTGNVSGICPECGRPISAAAPNGENEEGG